MIFRWLNFISALYGIGAGTKPPPPSKASSPPPTLRPPSPQGKIIGDPCVGIHQFALYVVRWGSNISFRDYSALQLLLQYPRALLNCMQGFALAWHHTLTRARSTRVVPQWIAPIIHGALSPANAVHLMVHPPIHRHQTSPGSTAPIHLLVHPLLPA